MSTPGEKFKFLTPNITTTYTAYPGYVEKKSLTNTNEMRVSGGVNVSGCFTSTISFTDADTKERVVINGVTNGAAVRKALVGH